jgi:hypothetical protein
MTPNELKSFRIQYRTGLVIVVALLSTGFALGVWYRNLAVREYETYIGVLLNMLQEERAASRSQ